MTRAADDVEILHPALDRALGAFPEPIAARAAHALRVVLHDRVATDGTRAWSSSRLTGDGFPVEFGFSTTDDRLRYTVEPGHSSADPRSRLDIAIGLLESLASSGLPADVIAACRRMHSLGRLSYGAWLASRHGLVDDEYKIYVEMPDRGASCEDPGFMPFDLPPPRLPDRPVKLRMIAYSPAPGRYEVYYRIRSLAPYHIPRVLAPCGLETRSDELLSYLAEAYGFSLRDKLPGESVGVSYSSGSIGSPDEWPSIVTLFFYARSLWGSDARIRRTFGRLSRELAWDDSCYQRVTAALASREICMTRHGLLGVALARNRRLSLSIGVRP